MLNQPAIAVSGPAFPETILCAAKGTRMGTMLGEKAGSAYCQF
jgi:hypothetical protein